MWGSCHTLLATRTVTKTTKRDDEMQNLDAISRIVECDVEAILPGGWFL